MISNMKKFINFIEINLLFYRSIKFFVNFFGSDNKVNKNLNIERS